MMHYCEAQTDVITAKKRTRHQALTTLGEALNESADAENCHIWQVFTNYTLQNML